MSNRKVQNEDKGNGRGRVSEVAAEDAIRDVATKQRAERRKNRGMGSFIDWSGAEAGAVLGLIVAATRAGDTITFSVTRDGGAVKVAIYDGNERYDEYCRPTEDMGLFLHGLGVVYE